MNALRILRLTLKMIFQSSKVLLNLNKENDNKMMKQFQRKFLKRSTNYSQFAVKIRRQEKKSVEETDEKTQSKWKTKMKREY